MTKPDTTPKSKCGNCGFEGNAHEMEVHASIHHISCDAPGCEACQMKRQLRHYNFTVEDLTEGKV